MLNFPTNFEKMDKFDKFENMFYPRKMKNGKFWKNQEKNSKLC